MTSTKQLIPDKNLAKPGVLCTALILTLFGGCAENKRQEAEREFDTVIANGLVFGDQYRAPEPAMIAVTDDRIAYVGDPAAIEYRAAHTIDASGKWVMPGFIDPHQHGLDELFSADTNSARNNLAQGVTTAFFGNDGYGNPDIARQISQLEDIGLKQNVALFAGHGHIRSRVMGRENRAPTTAELEQMKALVGQAMEEGAIGLSAGLFYVPGTYADTSELVALAQVAGEYGGVYESHVRDESNYSIGVVAAIDEAIDIGRQAKLPVHIAHIKALGVDVWGKSAEIIARVEAAREEGIRVTADQYPWLASAVQIHKALVPSWALEGGEDEIQERLNDPQNATKIRTAMAENLRRRGGPDSLLIVISSDQTLEGHTLAELARQWSLESVEAALKIMALGTVKSGTRVASFNMNERDLAAFMVQPWVMTSSDASNGHPRKFASYAEKFARYLREDELLTAQEFVYKSSGLVADSFAIPDRGYLKPGYFADIVIIDPQNYRPGASYSEWNKAATGVEYLLINGQLAVDGGQLTGADIGRGLRRGPKLAASEPE